MRTSMLHIFLLSTLTAFFVVLLLHGFLPWSKTCVCSSASTMDNSLKFAALGDSWKSIILSHYEAYALGGQAQSRDFSKQDRF